MAPLSLTCGTCGKQFKTYAHLQAHVITHTDERPYKCFQCEKSFRRKDQAKRHMKSHSKSNVTYLSCSAEGCPKKFKLERTMKRHFESAHVLHKCTFEGCELAFNKKRKMKKHLETHNDGKYHKCTYDGCTSVFQHKHHLVRHLENHEKVYNCTILGCEVSVKSWSELRKHVKTHNKIHCKECDVVCPNEAAFKKHCKDANHIPKQTVYCPYEGCSKSYCRTSNLNHHVRIAHEGRRFYCQVEGCGKSFRQNVSLKEHMVTHEYPKKKIKRNRKRKSLAAKLARYKGELCDLPVTYVDPNDGKASTVSNKTPSQECYVSMDSLSHQGDKGKEKCVEDTSLCSKSVPNTLIARLQMVIKGNQSHVNDSCSSESNSENNLSREHTQVVECSASS